MEAIVEYNYTAKEPDELTLRKGDIIKDIKVMPGGWWEGSLKDKRGMFPDNFVKVIDATVTSATTSGSTKSEIEVNTIGKKEQVTMRNGSSGSRWCKVLFSYDPCNEDELALVPNDVIEFLCEVEEGWWSGRIGNRIGVFPSNFVSPPTLEEPDNLKERDRDITKELCRVLFPYEAANEDELTLVEGDIITIISRDAPDKGWWKGELRGRIGLFPDNFVKIVIAEDESPTVDDTKSPGLKDGTKTNTKSSTTKSSYTGKKTEKAFVRKSLDTRVGTPEKKSVATSSTSPVASSGSTLIINSEKKMAVGGSNNTSMLLTMSMNLKRTTKNTNDDISIDASENIYGGVDEELDGIEREEYTPLLHLTASRVKAPRRRLPSSHYNRSQTSLNSFASSTTLQENTVTNGTTDTVDQPRNEESESILGKTRQTAPWIKELKLNQMEKKKTLSTDKFDKSDVALKKEKIYSHDPLALNVSEIYSDQNQDNDEIRAKDKDKDNYTYQRNNLIHLTCSTSPTTSPGGTAYVPYRLYCQLLDRVALLEEKQTALQRTVTQLTEQIGPLLANSSVNNKP